MLGRIRPVHVADAILIWSFLAAYLALLAMAGNTFGKGILESLGFGFLLPFLIFNGLISAAIFLHHTHYAVPWYASLEEWKQGAGAIYGTVHVEFPWIFRKLILHIMEHNAHHYAPSLPLYRLSAVQDLVKRPGVVTWQFSLSEYLNVCARCKLFDYATSRWLDFNGCATSETLRARS
jgi:omega-6 fatty acid desaturase (delta-12 desaturase)